MIEVGTWLVLHLGALAMMLLCAGGLGHIFLRRLEFDSLIERLVFEVGLGFGIASVVIFVLAAAHLLYSAVLIALTLAGTLATIFHLLRHRVRIWSAFNNWKTLPTHLRAAIALLLFIGIGYWAIIFLSALYPPFHWDPVSHHLILSHEYLAAHRMVVVDGITRPVLPALTHMLFSWALALKSDILAQLVQHTFLMLTAAGLTAFGKREKGAALGFALAAFWLSHPLVLYLGESAYIDIGLACFVFLGVYAFRIFWNSREAGWWYLAMALFGMAAGIKLPGLFFVIAGAVAGLISFWRASGAASSDVSPAEQLGKHSRPRKTAATLVFGCLLAVVLLLPWYGFIFYHTGDPFWPTFSELRRGAGGDASAIQDTSSWLNARSENKSLRTFLTLPFDWIRHPEWFDSETNAAFSPLLILWPLAWLVAIWNRSVRWWALWALAFTCFWFIFPHHLRYWLPALPLASIAIFESIRWLLDKFSKRQLLQNLLWTAVALSSLYWGYSVLINEVRGKGLPPPTNAAARERWLTSMRGYKGVKFINERSSEHEKVLVIRGSWINYYLKPQVIDLLGVDYRDRLPKFNRLADEAWLKWVESQDVDWIYLVHEKPPPYLKIPKDDPQTFWPDFQLVYADEVAYVLRRLGTTTPAPRR